MDLYRGYEADLCPNCQNALADDYYGGFCGPCDELLVREATAFEDMEGLDDYLMAHYDDQWE